MNSSAPPPPPPGFGMPDINHGPAIIAACATMTALALVAIVLRLWVRIVMIRSMGADDYFIVAAMLLSFIGMIIIIPEVAYGAGRHVAYIEDPLNISTGLKLNFITQPFYLFAITFVKVSIGLFLLRFAPTKNYKKFIWAVQAFMAAYTLVGICTLMTQCRPLSFLWTGVGQAVCFSVENLRALAYLNASLGIISDIIYAFLPIIMLWSIQVNSRVKVALFAIMSLGIFASAASIVKLSYLPSYGLTGDFLWDSTNLTIWTVTECNIGIIAASIPCLKPLFKAMLGGSTYGTGYGSQRKTKGYTQQDCGRPTNRHQSYIRSGSSSDDHAIEMYSGKSGTTTSTARKGSGANISEESIVPLHNFGGKGIRKTTQVQVTHASDGEGRDPPFPQNVEDRV